MAAPAAATPTAATVTAPPATAAVVAPTPAATRRVGTETGAVRIVIAVNKENANQTESDY